MAEFSKRSLRERRAPKNFDSENEDQDPWGYAKPSYSRPASQQELRNPSQQLNSDARLLVQFLTTINKKLKQYVTAHAKPQTIDIKEPPAQRDRKTRGAEGPLESQRRQNESKEGKIEGSKRAAHSQSLKAQINGAPLSYSKNDSLLSEYKALNAESANQMLNIENSLKNKQPTSDTQSKLQKMKQNNPVGAAKKPQSVPKNDARSPSSLQLQPNSSFINPSKENARREGTDSSSKSRANISENKIFKRSAYHVAIAYHIYLKKMREKGVIGNEIDPTYNARRLREDMGK